MKRLDFPALLLTGGQSKRMGHPKHLMDLGEGPLWKVLMDRLQTRFETVAVSKRAEQAGDFHGNLCIPDRWPDIGPMGGIASGLTFFPHVDRLFVLSCDLPFFEVGVLDLLLAQHTAEGIARCAQRASSDFPEPLVALWNRTALPALHKAIQSKDYSLQRLLRSQPHTTVVLEHEQWLFNANTPKDLKQAATDQRPGT